MGINIEFKGQKLTNSKKKKKAGAELKKKKRIFGPKIGKKFENKVLKLGNFKEKENKVQKLSNLKEKRTFLAQKTSSDFTPIQEDDRQHKKNKLGMSLRTKKGLFLGKNSDKP